MFNLTIKLPTDLFASIKALPASAYKQMHVEMEKTVKPAVQREVQDLVATYPGPVVYPFEFGTAKSRRAFFATQGFGRGIPTARTGALFRAWQTRYRFSGNVGALIIQNEADYAKYVYGFRDQRQIPGHRATGWGRDIPTALQLIDEFATGLIIDAWGRSVGLTIKEL